MTTTTHRISDTGGPDWSGIPLTRSHAALVRYAVDIIVESGAYGSAPDVQTTREGACADVHVWSHGEHTMLQIFAADAAD